MFKQSMYSRILIFGCVISIIPVLALGFFSYMKSSSALSAHVEESNIQMLDQVNGNMEQILRTVDYTLNYIINTNMIQEALYKNLSYTDFQFYNQLRVELSLIQSPDTRVTDVILANPSADWLINNQGMYSFKEASTKDLYLELMEQPTPSAWSLLPTASLGSTDTLSYGCPYTLTLVKKMPLHTLEKRGLAIATIPGCQMTELMGEQTNVRELMVIGDDLRILLHPDKELIGSSLEESGYIQPGDPALFEGSSGQFQTTVKGRAVSVNFIRSDYNGWIYASYTEWSEVNRESRSIFIFTFTACLLIILLTLWMVWLGSRKVYLPIRNLFQTVAARQASQEYTMQNELQAIDEHMRELFSSNTLLREELHQNNQQLISFFLMQLYQGQLKKESVKDKLRLLGYDQLTAHWQEQIVLVLQMDSLEQSKYHPKDMDLLLFAIHNIIEETISGKDRLPPLVMDQTVIVLAGFDMAKEELRDYCYTLTEELKTIITTYLKLEISIGISLPFSDIARADRAYMEGMEALKYRLTLGKGVIISYATLNAGKHTRVYDYPRHIEGELLDAIKLANSDSAKHLLSQWMSEVFRKEKTPQDYQTSLVQLLNTLLIMKQESGITATELRTDNRSLYTELLQLYVKSDIETWFWRALILPLLDSFHERQQNQNQNLSSQIIAMIHNEFESDITLEECAQRLHYNVYYLSSVFKKETSMSFSEYLSLHRFHMARKWLVETDMPIKDIAKRLAYNNPQNFIRSFRKQENMTPGQYRASNRPS